MRDAERLDRAVHDAERLDRAVHTWAPMFVVGKGT